MAWCRGTQGRNFLNMFLNYLALGNLTLSHSEFLQGEKGDPGLMGLPGMRGPVGSKASTFLTWYTHRCACARKTSLYIKH